MPHSKPSFDDYAYKRSTCYRDAFPILRTNSYGRMMIGAQMNTHDRLIRGARGRTDCFLSKFAEDQMEYNRMLEKWRPGYNELQKKARDDEILADLISSATHVCDTELDDHIKRFKKNRAKNPRYKPGWLESYVNGKNMAVHEEMLRKAGPRIDNTPPKKAMQFREFLKSCKYTRGGFLRPSKQRRPRPGELPTMASMGRSDSCPPNVGRPSPVPVDACGREKRLNPALVSKYSELVFRKNMDNATNDDVRVLYAQANDNDVPIPTMRQFIAQQGIDLQEMETEIAATYDMFSEGENVSPFGLGTLKEEDENEEELGAARGLGSRATAQMENEPSRAQAGNEPVRAQVVTETPPAQAQVATETSAQPEEVHVNRQIDADSAAQVSGNNLDSFEQQDKPLTDLTPHTSPEQVIMDEDQVALKVSSEAAVHVATLD